MVAALLAVALIGWADHASGPHVGFSLFYLVPVTVGAFWFGRAAGLLAALAGTAVWFAAAVAASQRTACAPAGLSPSALKDHKRTASGR